VGSRASPDMVLKNQSYFSEVQVAIMYCNLMFYFVMLNQLALNCGAVL